MRLSFTYSGGIWPDDKCFYKQEMSFVVVFGGLLRADSGLSENFFKTMDVKNK